VKKIHCFEIIFILHLEIHFLENFVYFNFILFFYYFDILSYFILPIFLVLQNLNFYFLKFNIILNFHSNNLFIFYKILLTMISLHFLNSIIYCLKENLFFILWHYFLSFLHLIKYIFLRLFILYLISIFLVTQTFLNYLNLFLI
jgi:hypothetical protein